VRTKTSFSWKKNRDSMGSRGRTGNKFFVFQARRLMPLLFLVLLLVALSVYDNFFKMENAVDVSQPVPESNINYTTAATGDLTGEPQFWLAYTDQQWEGLKAELALDLPDYPFNDDQEIGVFSLNGEIDSIEALPREQDLLIQVIVSPRSRYYHVVTIPRGEVEPEGFPVTWVFADREGDVIKQVTIPLQSKLEQTTSQEEPTEDETDSGS